MGLGLGLVGVLEPDDRGAVLGNDAGNESHMGGLVVTAVRSSKAVSLVNREKSTY
jgi:hypothetical protein